MHYEWLRWILWSVGILIMVSVPIALFLFFVGDYWNTGKLVAIVKKLGKLPL